MFGTVLDNVENEAENEHTHRKNQEDREGKNDQRLDTEREKSHLDFFGVTFLLRQSFYEGQRE
jgi:hypothetical protein